MTGKIMRRHEGAMRAYSKVLIALLVIFCGLGIPFPATADGEGIYGWYYGPMNIGAIHEAGFTGSGVTVAIIDGPIEPLVIEMEGADLSPDMARDFCTLQPQPPSVFEHATEMAALLAGQGGRGGNPGIAGISPDIKLLHYAIPAMPAFPGNEDCNINQYYLDKFIVRAVDDGADIISISMWYEPPGWEQLYSAVSYALAHGVIILACAGNDYRMEFPSTLNGVISVGAYNSYFSPSEWSGSGPELTITGPGEDIPWRIAGAHDTWDEVGLGEGTSAATPIVAGAMALAKQRWPQATGNQLTQSLIRNTWDGNPDAVHNEITGYGMASPLNLANFDPTIYPDVSPLLTKQSEGPSQAMIDRIIRGEARTYEINGPEYYLEGQGLLARPGKMNQNVVEPTPINTEPEPPAPIPSPIPYGGEPEPKSDTDPNLVVIGFALLSTLIGIVVVVVIVVAVSKSKSKPPFPPGGVMVGQYPGAPGQGYPQPGQQFPPPPQQVPPPGQQVPPPGQQAPPPGQQFPPPQQVPPPGQQHQPPGQPYPPPR